MVNSLRSRIGKYIELFRTTTWVIFVFFLFLAGCVSWRDNRVMPVTDFPSNYLDSTVLLNLNASLKSNGINAVWPDSFSKENTEKFLKIARSKNIFKEISSENKNPDYILEINYEVEGNGFSGLSVITLGLFPGFDRLEQTMHVELLRKKDLRMLDRFTITEKSSTVSQILLLFALPFCDTSREIYETSYNDIVENILERVYLDIIKDE